MTTYSYGQLEGFWDSAGGKRSLAPVMAAIALAESGGDPNAKNPNDNGGKQTSWGLWQVSNGTHIPPIGNWNDPLANAGEAVKIEKNQGLRAWGTFDSGKYKQFLKGGVPPSQAPNPPAQTSSIWTWILEHLPGLAGIFGGGGLGPIGGLFALLNPGFWVRMAKGAIGVGLILFGAYMTVHNTAPVQAARSAARSAGKDAAAAAILAPK